jgi:hypothetical protein
MKDFFSFRTMITPIIIQILFWVGVASCVILGIGYMVIGSRYYGGTAPLYGLMILIFGPLAVRIYCEILIIFFRINETMTEIKHSLDERRVVTPTPAQTPPQAA